MSFLLHHRRDAFFFILGCIVSAFVVSYFNVMDLPVEKKGLLAETNNSNNNNKALRLSTATATGAGALTEKQREMMGDTSIAIPFDPFPEPAWRTPNTLSVRTVTSTPFARFEIHQVRTESGAIVKDWLWTDERAHVNILVHLKEEDKYLLFRQRKYGLDREYLAAIGGLFDEGDTPESCARRELLEETGLEAEQLHNLGAYRVQVNRGGGILHAFLAKNCVKSKSFRKSDDYEKQAKVLLSKEELVKVALAGEIGEAQWLATIALGLIHEDQHKK